VQGFAEDDIRFRFAPDHRIRYFRMRGCPDRINEVRGYCAGKGLDRTKWRASNLLAPTFNAEAAWKATIAVDEIHEGSYLAIPVFGPHVSEAVYAAARCGSRYLGAARRAPSYPSNVFECRVLPGRNYSYFIPLTKDLEGKPIEVWLLGLGHCAKDEISSEVWVTAHPAPHASKAVVLKTRTGSPSCPGRCDDMIGATGTGRGS